jgi:hypothetical protein
MFLLIFYITYILQYIYTVEPELTTAKPTATPIYWSYFPCYIKVPLNNDNMSTTVIILGWAMYTGLTVYFFTH